MSFLPFDTYTALIDAKWEIMSLISCAVSRMFEQSSL
jgi:hypothetical protein